MDTLVVQGLLQRKLKKYGGKLCHLLKKTRCTPCLAGTLALQWRSDGSKKNILIHEVFHYLLGQWLHPRSLTWNLKIPPKGIGETTTNHQFLGSMLVFGGVTFSTFGDYIFRRENKPFKLLFQGPLAE